MDHDIDALDDEHEDFTTCLCGSTDIRAEVELMRPWFTEYHCQDCDTLRRGLS
ncbi:hypothetical protein [Kitasatospora sp. NPDC127116]|uniref:hypothetical protein n=1 Tax=Kitasatospora sp. NPDC127116 TaxID=3345367 RepID=UPI0036383286